MSTPSWPTASLTDPMVVAALRKRIEELFGEARQEEAQDTARAGASRGAYEQLAGAPLPEVDPVAAGGQQLFGDVASIISRRPEFGERTREDIKQRGAMLLQQRIQNIQILRDRYQEDAARVGKLDPIRALELNEKTERMNKLLEQLHEREKAEFGAAADMARQEKADTAAMERVTKQGETDIAVANINADARLLRAMASGGAGEGQNWGPKERSAYFNDQFKLFTDPKTKKIPKEKLPLFGQILITAQHAPGQTSEQWTEEMVRLISAAKGPNAKLSPREFEDIVRGRALHKFADSASPTTPPATSGTIPTTEVTAPAPEPTLTFEGTPAGAAPGRVMKLRADVERLYTSLQTPVRGPTDAVIKKRQTKQLASAIKELASMGITVSIPPPTVEGIEVQDYTDEFLNTPAR